MEEKLVPSATDVNFMKQYLKDIYTLEKELYCSQRAKQELDNKISTLGKNNLFVGKYDTYGRFEYKIEALPILGKGLIGSACTFIFAIWARSLFESNLAAFVVLSIGFVIGCIVGFCEENSMRNNSLAKIAERRKDEERIKEENEQINIYRSKQTPFINNISSCQKSLNQLYNLNIIFPKYHNLIAIAQIYEYYMSGRCTQLEGHEGAYNIFESELRQNVIISQLNDVLANLEEIKRTQYMIYEAIQASNRILGQIESNTAATAYNTSVIAANSAICARYVQS